MAAPFSKTRYTTQYMQNWGFDDTFKVPTVEIVAYNSDTNVLERVKSTDGVLEINSTTLNSLITAAYDYIGITYPTTSSEVYVFKSGGVSGTTVGTITVTYSDAVTKQIITSVAKT